MQVIRPCWRRGSHGNNGEKEPCGDANRFCLEAVAGIRTSQLLKEPWTPEWPTERDGDLGWAEETPPQQGDHAMAGQSPPRGLGEVKGGFSVAF